MAQNTGSNKATTTIGTVSSTNLSTFSASRNSNDGNGVDQNSTGFFGLSSLPGPPDKFTMVRYFLAFPLTGVPNNTYRAELTIAGGAFATFPGPGSIRGVLASKPTTSTNIATGDYRAGIVGFATGQSMSGNVTDVTLPRTSWITGASFPTNTFTFATSGVSYIGNPANSILQVAMVSDSDYTNVSPGIGDYYVNYAHGGTASASYPTLIYYFGVSKIRVDDTNSVNVRRINDISDAVIYQINGVNV